MASRFKIPLAFVDYIARFDRPYIEVIGRRLSNVLERGLTVLAPYNVKLADCEVITAGPLPDHRITFKMPERGISFHVSAESIRFAKENPYWAEAEDVLKMIDTVEGFVVELTKATIVSRTTNLAIHMQVLDISREEVLAPFIPAPLHPYFEPGEMTSFGNHLKWKNGSLLLDFSAAVANGVFARLISESSFSSAKEAFEDAHAHQVALYKVLNIEEDVDAPAA